MNNIQVFAETHLLPPDGLKYGLSTSHAWVRCIECVLHISYKLDMGKHQARTEEDKVSVSLKKKKIQVQMKEQLGFVIDVPKSGGSGASNDGNTGRRFFENAQIVSSITGFDLHLMKMIYVVCCVTNIVFRIQIDPDAFQMYCRNITNRYVEYSQQICRVFTVLYAIKFTSYFNK